MRRAGRREKKMFQEVMVKFLIVELVDPPSSQSSECVGCLGSVESPA